MQLLVVRHGQPFDETDTGGDGDPPLTDLGLAQASAICSYLETQGVDHIVASPMVRARQTGEPLAAALGLDMEFDDDLKEAGWQLGKYERGEEHAHRYAQLLADDPEYFYRPEGREVFTGRVMGVFDRLVNEHPGKTVAVFCHGMVQIALATHCMGLVPPPSAFDPDYTGLMRVRASAQRDIWSMISFNETMHLVDVG